MARSTAVCYARPQLQCPPDVAKERVVHPLNHRDDAHHRERCRGVEQKEGHDEVGGALSREVGHDGPRRVASRGDRPVDGAGPAMVAADVEPGAAPHRPSGRGQERRRLIGERV